jgi:hypothetical protein
MKVDTTLAVQEHAIRVTLTIPPDRPLRPTSTEPAAPE